MTPADLLRSLVACYPPEETLMERSGGLQGERQQPRHQQPQMLQVCTYQPHQTVYEPAVTSYCITCLSSLRGALWSIMYSRTRG